MDRNSLSRFYTSYIRPVLEYSNIVWNNCTTQESELLESVQLDAARIITGLRRGTSHAILYNELGWIPLSERRQNSKLIHFFKILNFETPNYINKIINDYNSHETTYTLRSNNLRYPTPRTTSFKNSYFPSTIDLWNNLDSNLSSCTSLYSFKKELRKKIRYPPKYYSYGDRKLSIILCQLRNSKSQLNEDLFNDHLIDSPNCLNCNCPESAQHFLLKCPKFNNERMELINSLMSEPSIYSTISLSPRDLLSGNSNLSHEDNCTLIKLVMSYIQQTKRL